MKIAHAQLHMYTNIMYKFQSSTCKTRRKAPDKIVSMDGQTDGQTAMAIPVYPLPLRCGGYNDYHQSSERILAKPENKTSDLLFSSPYPRIPTVWLVIMYYKVIIIVYFTT